MIKAEVALIRNVGGKMKITLLQEQEEEDDKVSLNAVFCRMFPIIPVPKKWRMRQIFVHHVWKVPKIHQQKYVDALKTQKARELINELKNSRSNQIINEFLEGEEGRIRKGIGNYNREHPDKPVRKNGSMLQYIKELISLPLRVHNSIKHETLGISKKEIYEMLLANGLIS